MVNLIVEAEIDGKLQLRVVKNSWSSSQSAAATSTSYRCTCTNTTSISTAAPTQTESNPIQMNKQIKELLRGFKIVWDLVVRKNYADDFRKYDSVTRRKNISVCTTTRYCNEQIVLSG